MHERIRIEDGSTLTNTLKPIVKSNMPNITYENYIGYPGLLKKHKVPHLKKHCVNINYESVERKRN